MDALNKNNCIENNVLLMIIIIIIIIIIILLILYSNVVDPYLNITKLGQL